MQVGNIGDLTRFKISELAGVKLDRDVNVVGFKDGSKIPLPPGTGYIDKDTGKVGRGRRWGWGGGERWGKSKGMGGGAGCATTAEGQGVSRAIGGEQVFAHATIPVACLDRHSQCSGCNSTALQTNVTDTCCALPLSTQFVPPGELVEGYTRSMDNDGPLSLFGGRDASRASPERVELDLDDPTPFDKQLYDQVRGCGWGCELWVQMVMVMVMGWLRLGWLGWVGLG